MTNQTSRRQFLSRALRTLGGVATGIAMTGCYEPEVQDSDGNRYLIISYSNGVPTRLQNRGTDYLTPEKSKELGFWFTINGESNFEITPELQQATIELLKLNQEYKDKQRQAKIRLRGAVERAQTLTRDKLQGLEE